MGLKILKNKLSEYVRLAASGETVLVTDRDRVVAELSSPTAGRSLEVSDALLADAVRQGWLTPAVHPQKGTPPRRPVMSFDEVMRGLDDDRADR